MSTETIGILIASAVVLVVLLTIFGLPFLNRRDYRKALDILQGESHGWLVLSERLSVESYGSREAALCSDLLLYWARHYGKQTKREIWVRILAPGESAPELTRAGRGHANATVITEPLYEYGGRFWNWIYRGRSAWRIIVKSDESRPQWSAELLADELSHLTTAVMEGDWDRGHVNPLGQRVRLELAAELGATLRSQ